MQNPLDIIRNLEDRVAHLEAQLGDQVQPDNIQPNVLTVNPDGSIGANLTGHLKAQGVDLTAGASQTPPDQDRVRWLRASDGAVIAAIYSYEDVPNASDALTLTAGTGDATKGTRITHQTITNTNGYAAQLVVDATGTVSQIFGLLSSPGTNRFVTLLNSAQQSNFLQLMSAPANAQLQFGHLPGVASDAGGWCNFLLPAAYGTQIDAVLAVNDWQASSGAAFSAVQPNPAGSKQAFRAFVTTPGLTCSCTYIAIGH